MVEEIEGTEEGAATAVQEESEGAVSSDALAESFAEAFPEGDVPKELEADAGKTDENKEDGASAEEQTSDAATEGEGDDSGIRRGPSPWLVVAAIYRYGTEMSRVAR